MAKGKGLSPMDYAMSYLTARDRTVFEMQTYLDGKEFGEADVEATVGRLQELGLLNDRRFAAQFVQTRLATKPLSRAHLYRQLAEHHIDKEIIVEALAELPDETELENAVAVAEKFARQFAALEPEKRRQRILSRLQARGYGYDVCYKALDRALAALEEEA